MEQEFLSAKVGAEYSYLVKKKFSDIWCIGAFIFPPYGLEIVCIFEILKLILNNITIYFYLVFKFLIDNSIEIYFLLYEIILNFSVPNSLMLLLESVLFLTTFNIKLKNHIIEI